uniref:Uncharacterized protein n=1 Tax=Tetranychus urticae TaxID=32264 RepID=T1KHH5_TETUR
MHKSTWKINSPLVVSLFNLLSPVISFGYNIWFPIVFFIQNDSVIFEMIITLNNLLIVQLGLTSSFVSTDNIRS